MKNEELKTPQKLSSTLACLHTLYAFLFSTDLNDYFYRVVSLKWTCLPWCIFTSRSGERGDIKIATFLNGNKTPKVCLLIQLLTPDGFVGSLKESLLLFLALMLIVRCKNVIFLSWKVNKQYSIKLGWFYFLLVYQSSNCFVVYLYILQLYKIFFRSIKFYCFMFIGFAACKTLNLLKASKLQNRSNLMKSKFCIDYK